MRFQVACHLEYDITFPSPLILNIHAQRNSSQAILSEDFSIEPRVKVEEFVIDGSGNRFVRLETGRKKHLSISYEATVGTTLLGSHDISDEDIERLVGQPIEQAAGPGQLTQLLAPISRLAQAEEPVDIVIESASRLMRTPGELSEAEFSFFRGVDRVCRTAALRPTDDGRLVHSPVVWIVDSDRDLPSWFTLRNEALRTISVPMPLSGEREQMATNLLPGLAKSSVFEGPLDRPTRVLTEQTAGMGLSASKNIVHMPRGQALAEVIPVHTPSASGSNGWCDTESAR